jgi:hypothetical protein
VLIFGTISERQEDSCRWDTLDKTVEHRLRFGVDPVGVFQKEQDRLFARLAKHKSPDRVENALAHLARIEACPLLVLSPNVQ